jgi:DNA polymerase elongation subunit (family B)
MTFYTNVQNWGGKIYYRGIDSAGNHFKEKLDYNPTLFINSPKPTEYKTLEGKYLAPVECGNIRETRDFIKKYDGIDNFQIYGNTNYHYTFIADNFPDQITYDLSKIITANIDIETGSENGFPNPETAPEPVTAITVSIKNTYYVFGCDSYKKHRSDIIYFECENELHLLQEFLSFWSKQDIDVVTGWNIKFFDIPYLVNRINLLFEESLSADLSPWRFVSERTIGSFGGSKQQQAYEIMGVATLDYIDLYKKFTYKNQESYALNHIAHVELNERKLDYSEYGSLHNLWKEDHQKFIEYNVKDVELINRLEDKMKLIEMAIVLSYDAKVNYTDVYTQVRMWDTLIYNELRSKGIQLPPKKNTIKDRPYEGAFVKEPVPGMYEWVASFDLDSLYPHLIMQYNISPETLLTDFPQKSLSVDKLLDQEIITDYAKTDDICIGANGFHFTNDFQGFLPEMMERMYAERKKFKKDMLKSQQLLEQEADGMDRLRLVKEVSRLNNMQMARKIQLNSAYGALGNQYFRFYDERNATAITTGGQLSIRWVEKSVNIYLNKLLKTVDKDYIIAADTDSIYICLDKLVKSVFTDTSDKEKIIKFLDKVCQTKIQDCINDSFAKLHEYMNSFEQKMNMSREVLADKAIWTGKKHYIMNVHNSEGVQYAKPKLKVMGLESVKSSTPAVCREKLHDSFKILIEGTEEQMINFIETFKESFRTLPPEDISFPRSVNGIGKYSDSVLLYKKGTPIHVKGTIIHNKLLKDHKLTKKYQIIQEGEKIKFSYLKEPNPVGDTVISMGTVLPTEFGLHEYINYNMQFEKSFLEPLKTILSCVGWDYEKRSTLENFFI